MTTFLRLVGALLPVALLQYVPRWMRLVLLTCGLPFWWLLWWELTRKRGGR